MAPFSVPYFQDYMEAQMAGSYEAAIVPSQADNRYMAAPPKSEGGGARYSSYSGSSFNTHMDPDNVAIDKSPIYSGYVHINVCCSPKT